MPKIKNNLVMCIFVTKMFWYILFVQVLMTMYMMCDAKILDKYSNFQTSKIDLGEKVKFVEAVIDKPYDSSTVPVSRDFIPTSWID